MELDADSLKADYSKQVRISRLHLEVDSGKSIHDMHPTMSLIDLNRCGTALMEIVSEPDMRSSNEAAAYVKKLQSLLQHIGTCDANMEEVTRCYSDRENHSLYCVSLTMKTTAGGGNGHSDDRAGFDALRRQHLGQTQEQLDLWYTMREQELE